MLVGRNQEYVYFEECWKRPGSQLVVFYGQKFLGKTTFLLDFCKDRPFSYCLARAGCEKWMLEELTDAAGQMQNILTESKKILIVDEFQNLAKAEAFMPFCLNLMEKENVLIVLVSSDIHWVEASLVKCFGRNAARISGFVKCRELSFGSICRMYPDCGKTQLFLMYCILGGVPGLWNFVDLKQDVRQNVEENILSGHSYLRHAGYLYCMEGLRESGVYDTILSAMAMGNHKLNDLYRITGYSRAKISVYLKTLMEQEQIVKAYSVDCPSMENTKKGIYEIGSHFTDFWFTFVYRYEKELAFLSPHEFYGKYIEGRLSGYCEKYLRKIVKEYLLLTGIMRRDKKGTTDRFLGKKKELDLVWRTDDGYAVVGCHKLRAMFSYEDYRDLTDAAKEAGLTVSDYYLVSYQNFDEKLTFEARMKKNLHLLTFDEIMKVFE